MVEVTKDTGKRTVKKAEERRAEILAVAQGLVNSQGYENTSVQEIIDAVGISKGAFYHYFKSKEDVLDALTRGMAERGAAEVALIAAGDGTALEKLNRAFQAGWAEKEMNKEVLVGYAKLLVDPANVQLRAKNLDYVLELVAPEVDRILIEGNESGEFKIGGRRLGRHILQLGVAVNELVLTRLAKGYFRQPDIDECLEAFRDFEFICARTLAIEPECLEFLDEAAFRKIVTPFLKEEK